MHLLFYVFGHVCKEVYKTKQLSSKRKEVVYMICEDPKILFIYIINIFMSIMYIQCMYKIRSEYQCQYLYCKILLKVKDC